MSPETKTGCSPLGRSVPSAAPASPQPLSPQAAARAKAAERKRAYEAFKATQPTPKNQDEERALQAAFSQKLLEDNRIASLNAEFNLRRLQDRARESAYGKPALVPAPAPSTVVPSTIKAASAAPPPAAPTAPATIDSPMNPASAVAAVAPPVGVNPSVSAIYEAKNEAEALAAARKFVLGTWTYTGKGYETGVGFKWMKWVFNEDGSMFFYSVYASDGKWGAADKRRWEVSKAILIDSKKPCYIVTLAPQTSGSIIIRPDGRFEWSFENMDLVFQRGDASHFQNSPEPASPAPPAPSPATPDPKLATAHWQQGDELRRLGNLKGAVEEYSKSIKLNPADSRIYVSRGTTLTCMGEFKGAGPDFLKAREVDPKNALAWSGGAELLGLVGRWQDSVNDFDKAIKVNPRLTGFVLARYVAQLHLGDVATASKELRAAMARKGEAALGDHLTDLARVLLGELDEKSVVEKSRKWGPEAAAGTKCQLWYLLGMSRLATGKKAEAAKYFRGCLETKWHHGTDFWYARIHLARLDAGK